MLLRICLMVDPFMSVFFHCICNMEIILVWKLDCFSQLSSFWSVYKACQKLLWIEASEVQVSAWMGDCPSVFLHIDHVITFQLRISINKYLDGRIKLILQPMSMNFLVQSSFCHHFHLVTVNVLCIFLPFIKASVSENQR